MPPAEDQRAVNALFATTVVIGTISYVGLTLVGRLGPHIPLEAHVAATTVLLMGLPLLGLYLLTPADVTAIGFIRGDTERSGVYIWKSILLALPFLVIAVLIPATHQAYPLWGDPPDRPASSIGIFASWGLPGIVAAEALILWRAFVLEFFFRGFLLFGLVRRIGGLAVVVQMVPFAFLYWNQPFTALAAAWPAGFLLGFIAWRCRSFLPAAAVHLVVLLLLEIATAL